ncbi:MAG: hypothetical protein AB2385_16785 [Symbiobacterium sp.]|uniref:hypothetical protein n=1 Tax=Symbiobacterium sp. TaxID=1971213 RepID=UPI003463D909
MDLIWDWMDKASIIIGLGTFLFSALTWFQVRRMRKRWAEQARRITVGDQAVPGVLIINVASEPISATVRRFVATQEWGWERLDELPWQEVVWAKEVTPEILDDLLDRVRTARAELQARGCDSLHLFIRGPVMIGALVGALLGNGIPTILYHMDSKQGYQSWGYLYRGR